MNSTNQTLELDPIFTEETEAPNSGQWMQRMPAILRAIGAAAVLFSLYNFLMRGWEGSGDLLRYLMLLGHTGALAAIGLASGHYLKEGKGARLLLTLALVSVATNFAILGGFIYSATSSGAGVIYPEYVAWSVGSMSSALVLTAGALLVLLPVIRIGFLTLARGISGRMSLLFIASNAALLVPLRSPELVAVMVVLLGVVAIAVTGKTAQEYSGAKTREGVIALLLQFLPIAILLGRNVWLYSPEVVLFSAGLLTAFIALRQIALQLDGQSTLRLYVEHISAVTALLSGFSITATIGEAGGSMAMAMTCGTIVASVLSYEIALRASAVNSLYRILAALTMTIGLITTLLMFGGLMASLVTLIIGLLMVAMSYSVEQRAIFIGGIILSLSGLGYQFKYALGMFDLGYWATLAIVGVAAILIGSLLESQGGRIKPWLQAWRDRFTGWGY